MKIFQNKMCLSTFLPQKDRDPDLILAQCAQGKMWLKAADYLVFIKHLHQISSKSNKNLFEPIERRHKKNRENILKENVSFPSFGPPRPAPYHHLHHQRARHHNQHLPFCQVLFELGCCLNYGAIWIMVLFKLWCYFKYGAILIMVLF